MSHPRRGRPNESNKKKKSQRRLGFERKSHGFGDEDVDVEVDTVDLNAPKKPSRSTSFGTKQKDKQVNEAMAADSKKNALISFTTDDFKIKRLVSSTSDLPLNKYTSLGAIFQNRHMTKTFAGHSYPVVKTPKDKLTTHHVLGPLTPGKLEEAEKTEKIEAISAHIVPPKQFPEAERPDEVRLGVIQVERVPIGQSKGNTETGSDSLPTWVSPLYRCYGIGGPYGPFGPFYEPPNIDVETTETAKVLFEPPPPPKKCLLMRVWESFRKKGISAKDNSLAMYLALLDEKLAAIRELLRTSKKDDREMMNDVMNSLSVVFDEAKNFESKMDSRDDERPSMTDFENDFGDDRTESLDILKI